MRDVTVPLPVDDVATLRRRRSAKWRAHPADVLPLPVAEMDFGLAPGVQEALLDAVRRGDTGYAYPGTELAESMARFAERRWGWRVDPALTGTAPDVAVGCVDVLRVLCEPGDTVVVSSPVYPPFFQWVEEAGAKLLDAPLRLTADGRWRLDLGAIEEAFAARPRVYVLCHPHNPVGRVHSRAELTEVARLAQEYGVVVISDEIHAPLVLPGTEFTPFLTVPGAAEVGLSLLSTSKAWNLAGLKCALVVAGSPRMHAVIERRPPGAHWRLGHLGVLASIAALDDDVWLDSLLATLDARRRQLAALLTEQLPQVRWVPPEATYLAWLDCREIGQGSAPYEHFLTDAKVALEPGPNFGGATGSGWVRLNFGTSEEILFQAVRRMAASLA